MHDHVLDWEGEASNARSHKYADFASGLVLLKKQAGTMQRQCGAPTCKKPGHVQTDISPRRVPLKKVGYKMR